MSAVNIWENVKFRGSGSGNSIVNVLADELLRFCLNKPARRFSAEDFGQFPKGKFDFTALTRDMESLGYFLYSEASEIIPRKRINDFGTNSSNWVYISGMGYAVFSFSSLEFCSFSVAGINKELVEATKQVVNKYFKKVEQKGLVYALINGQSGLKLAPLGNLSTPFFEDNYAPEIVNGYKYIVKQFKSSEPKGRMAIVMGPPGTGKTHLIQSLTGELADAMFIMVPANMIGQLATPGLLTLLLDHPGKKVLVLEDCDTALIKRNDTDTNLVSGLLNLADGIFGKSLDLRIIATTNAKEIQMDEAILRPGRLCHKMNVDKLDVEQARKVLTRINPDADPYQINEPITLATIYGIANEVNLGKTTVTKKRSMGFGN